jgi:hypothetical protein
MEGEIKLTGESCDGRMGWGEDGPAGSPTILKSPPEPWFPLSCSSSLDSVGMCWCCCSSLSLAMMTVLQNSVYYGVEFKVCRFKIPDDDDVQKQS